MKFIDGQNIDCSSVKEVIAALTALSAGQKQHAIIVTDGKGNPVERIKLFQQRLTDGSNVYSIEIHFEETA